MRSLTYRPIRHIGIKINKAFKKTTGSVANSDINGTCFLGKHPPIDRLEFKKCSYYLFIIYI